MKRWKEGRSSSGAHAKSVYAFSLAVGRDVWGDGTIKHDDTQNKTRVYPNFRTSAHTSTPEKAACLCSELKLWQHVERASGAPSCVHIKALNAQCNSNVLAAKRQRVEREYNAQRANAAKRQRMCSDAQLQQHPAQTPLRTSGASPVSSRVYAVESVPWQSSHFKTPLTYTQIKSQLKRQCSKDSAQ